MTPREPQEPQEPNFLEAFRNVVAGKNDLRQREQAIVDDSVKLGVGNPDVAKKLARNSLLSSVASSDNGSPLSFGKLPESKKNTLFNF